MATIFVTLLSSAFADDIDIFQQEGSPIPANVMFVLDGSGSMEELVGTTAKTRMTTVKSALTSFISNYTDPINIGLMSFSNTVTGVASSFDPNHLVHGPSYPVSALDSKAVDILSQNTALTNLSDSFLPAVVSAAETSQEYGPRVIQQWTTGGRTPIVGSLMEAAKYMRGDNIQWGNKSPNEIEAAHPSTYTNGFIADGSTTSTETCSAAFGLESCDELTTCTVARNFSCGETDGPKYGSNIDVVGDNCTLNGRSSTMKCPKGKPVCGIGTPATCSIFTTKPEVTTPNTYCSAGATVAACNAISGLSNCTTSTAEGSTVSRIYCDKTVPAWDQYICPARENPNLYTCRTQVTACKQNKCRTENLSDLTYNSPINAECQNNAIILLSDGGPSVNDSSTLVSNMIGPTFANSCKNTTAPADLYNWGSPAAIAYYGRCGPELASFLANTDNSDATIGNDIAGDQAINLYTIGFALATEPEAEQYLKDLAAAGGGDFFYAEDEANLIRAFENAVSAATNRARLFSSPTYRVNPAQPLLNGSSVYLPLFNAKGGASWKGNLKKFNQVNGVLKDANGNDIYDTHGKMLGTAKDLWSAGTPMRAVKDGGAANKIDPDTRKVLTDAGPAALIPLNTSNVTAVQLEATEAERAGLINYAQGYKADAVTPRHEMGDIIHSKPIYFHYKGLARTATKGGVIFIGTNEGFVHAINDNDGTEAFAYMPQVLLKNIKKVKNSDQTAGAPHVYGVDGPITLRFDDANHDGSVDSGDKVMLYFGLRRGGKSYYALDVTDPDSPKLEWEIKTDSSNFSELGFTWSKPRLAKLRVGSDIKPVLIFGGGYVDDNGGEAADSGTGSSVYIVNADTGDLIWKPSDAAISYAVAGNIKPVDIDRDGTVDRLYFGDTGGSIWRVDLNVSLAAANATHGSFKARIEEFADLGGKFFNEPDVAIFRKHGKLSLTVAIGSGDRTNPSVVPSADYFYVLFDENVIATPTSAVTAITPTDLGAPATVTAKGWKLAMETASGEKVLSKASTFQSKIVFTSFRKGATSGIPTAANGCSTSAINQSRIYYMDLLTGSAVLTIVDPSDPSSTIPGPLYVPGKEGVIMETPQVVFTEFTKEGGGTCVKGDCVRKYTIPGVVSETEKSLTRAFWIDNK